MTLLVVVLAVVAAAALAALLVLRSRLAGQRRLAAAADERVATLTGELDRARAEADAATRLAAAADERAVAAGERAAAADAHAAAAAERVQAAEHAATDADRRAALAVGRGGVDPDVLWALERLRTERTWRHSVAVGPDAGSALDGTDQPLVAAVQVELDAAREEVGAEVELETTLDAGGAAAVTPAGSVLALRVVQELLAVAVRRGEVTTVRLHADGHDLVVAVHAVDEHGSPIEVEPLPLPESAVLRPLDGGVRIPGALDAPA